MKKIILVAIVSLFTFGMSANATALVQSNQLEIQASSELYRIIFTKKAMHTPKPRSLDIAAIGTLDRSTGMLTIEFQEQVGSVLVTVEKDGAVIVAQHITGSGYIVFPSCEEGNYTIRMVDSTSGDEYEGSFTI